MPTFTYTARRGTTESLSGIVEAVDRDQAIANLKRRGLFLLTIRSTEADGSEASTAWARSHRISREDVAVLTSQLASLLRAGLPLVSALRALQEQMAGSTLARVLEQLGADISESASLSEAMGKFPRFFPKTYTAAVRAGEESGMLAEILGRLAKNLKNEVEVRGKIRGALAYPIFLCVLGSVTLAVLLTFVIPRFTKLFVTMGEQLPLPTRILLAFSGTMDRFWPVVAIVLIGLVVAIGLAVKQEPIRAVVDRYLLMVPWVGSIIRRSETARFARTLSELLNSGVPILNGLQITRGVMANRCFSSSMDKVREGVAKGMAVADVLKSQREFTPLVVNMVAVGEQSGQLPELLVEVAEIYEKECERAIQAFTTILGPALIVVVGGVIAFVIAAILLPVFEASTLVG
jgi:general secretion pathway protein F